MLGNLATSPGVVWVVENPSTLALAVARFGSRCPPMVCCSGWPNNAVSLLLQLLSQAGADLRYHGDLDGEGIRIAAHVCEQTGAVPWRMSTMDYLAAVAKGLTGPTVGRVTAAPWDANLAAAMLEHQVAVTEERRAELLLQELARQGLEVATES
jgi:uncharacterized protein (TIGR02679 family)